MARLGEEVPQHHVRGWAVAGLWASSHVCGRAGASLSASPPLFSPLRHRCETTKPATQGRANGEAPRASLILTTQTTSSQPCRLIASVRVSIISRTARARVRGGAADLGRCTHSEHSVRTSAPRAHVNTRCWMGGAHRPRETLGR